MELEMHLQQALLNSFEKFQDMTKQISSDMSQKTGDYFKVITDKATEFHEQLKIHALDEQTDFETRFEQVSKELEEDPENEDLMARLELLGDTETVKGHLEQSREFMENAISKNEKDITRKIKEDIESNLDKISLNQHTRNRNIIKEIIETSQSFKDAIKNNFDKMREEFEAE